MRIIVVAAVAFLGGSLFGWICCAVFSANITDEKWEIMMDDLPEETEEVKNMNKIVICPYRTYTEVRPAILKGQGDVTVTGFMDCLREQCPAFRVEGEYSYRLGETEYTEHCLRLEGEKK